MAKDIKLDSDGNIDLSSGDIQFVEGIDFSKQSVKIRLKMAFGEWFLDTRMGVKYKELIFSGHNTPRKLERISNHLKSIILGTVGITTIKTYSQSIVKVGGKNVLRVVASVLYNEETEIQINEDLG